MRHAAAAGVKHPTLKLYLLRHADAGDPERWHGDDAERPLSPKGVRQAERLGRHLKAIGFDPDVVISSPKVRARDTAEIVARAAGREVRIDARLAGSFDTKGLDEILADAERPERPLIVGHDPDFSDVAARLTGVARLELKKGALARLDLDGSLEPGGAVLRWLVPPDLLLDEPEG